MGNILIVITDGQSTDQAATLQQATELHNLGVNVLAVGVGDSVDQTELAGIASSAQNVYTVSNFDALSTLQDSLERTTCNGMLNMFVYRPVYLTQIFWKLRTCLN